MLNNYKRKCSTPAHFLYNIYKKTLVKSVNIMLHSQKRLILKCHQTLKIPFKEHNGKQKEAIQSPSKLLTTIGTKTTTRLDHLTMGCIQNWYGIHKTADKYVCGFDANVNIQ